jgi:hypothetical protein
MRNNAAGDTGIELVQGARSRRLVLPSGVERVQYWTNRSLPFVVVVLPHPETERGYWQLVNAETLVETSTDSWSLSYPTSTSSTSALGSLLQHAQSVPNCR